MGIEELVTSDQHMHYSIVLDTESVVYIYKVLATWLTRESPGKRRTLSLWLSGGILIVFVF